MGEEADGDVVGGAVAAEVFVLDGECVVAPFGRDSGFVEGLDEDVFLAGCVEEVEAEGNKGLAGGCVGGGSVGSRDGLVEVVWVPSYCDELVWFFIVFRRGLVLLVCVCISTYHSTCYRYKWSSCTKGDKRAHMGQLCCSIARTSPG